MARNPWPDSGKMRLSTIVPLLLMLIGNCAQASPAPLTPAERNAASDEGIRFSCQPEQIASIESAMTAYLASLGISPALVVTQADQTHGSVVYTLNTPREDTNTLNLYSRAKLKISGAMVRLPAGHGKERKVQTVSKKEILLALLQHGRLTEFTNDSCDVNALKEHIGIRQNIVAWSENLNWIFPDGRRARWNKKYWRRGTPKPGFPLHEAVNDVFLNQKMYSIGCYTTTKLLVMQGIIDYYRRAKPDPAQQQLLEERLYRDHEPLADIEPGRMWNFEKNYDQRKLHRPGKLLTIAYGVAANNFVPGDWIYLLNTDPLSYKKAGYEGSNPIYLGRNKFADYYNDNHHAYTYQQKVDEVYQWKNGVFSRSRDFARIKPLTPRDMERLSRTPAEGGLLTDMRVFPYFFGYQTLPVLDAPQNIEAAR